MEKAAEKLSDLLQEQESAAFNHERLLEITAELEVVRTNQATLEEEWLAATLALENQ